MHIGSGLHDRLFLSRLTRSVVKGSIHFEQKEIEILWQSIEEVWRIPILFSKVSVLTPARNISRQLRHDKKQRGVVRDSSRQARLWLSWVKLPAG